MNEILREFLAGWIGGAAGLVVGHPLDTVKVRVQSLHYSNTAQCVLQTVRNESLTGFYKGLLFPFLSAGLLHSLYFGGHATIVNLLSARNDQKDAQLSPQHHPETPYSHLFLGSTLGAVLQWIPSCPIEVVKVKLQIQTDSKQHTNPFRCFSEVFRHQGIRGLYKGGSVLLSRDVIALASYLPTYEWICRSTSKWNSKKGSHAREMMQITLAGGIAGVVSWLIILPLDLVKSRMQADRIDKPRYTSVWHCAKKSYYAEGLPVFYRGWLMVSCRAFPVNAVIFLAYDKFRAHFCFECK